MSFRIEILIVFNIRLEILLPNLGKPLTSTLLMSTFVFRSGGVPLGGVRARVVFSGDFPGRGFLSLSTEKKKRVPEAPFEGIKRVRGAPLGY